MDWRMSAALVRVGDRERSLGPGYIARTVTSVERIDGKVVVVSMASPTAVPLTAYVPPGHMMWLTDGEY